MFDRFGRQVTSLRLSVTDRCDLRCFYCMTESVTFTSRRELCSLEELDRICGVLIQLGVCKIRLTGGEPFVRNGFMKLVRLLSRHLGEGGLEELTMTTNGIRLSQHAVELLEIGVRRVNVSVDSLRPDLFLAITRHGRLARVLDGITAAARAGLRIRINTVVLAGLNEDELIELVLWSGDHGYDICFIEVMPLGSSGRYYMPISRVQTKLAQRFTLTESDYRSSGPARYVNCVETGQRIGFIAPMSSAFCESCDRIRLTCAGILFPCLGQEHSVDLRVPMLLSKENTLLVTAIAEALRQKSRGHSFAHNHVANKYGLTRRMSVTGG